MIMIMVMIENYFDHLGDDKALDIPFYAVDL